MNEQSWVQRILNLPVQASEIAPRLDGLHYFVIAVTMFGTTAIGLTAAYFLYRYRRKQPYEPTTEVRAHLGMEVVWITLLLGFFLIWWFIGYLQYLDAYDAPEDAMEVYVTGKQWMWKFAYPNGRSSVNILTVPVGQPVELKMISRDVIHSFFVPQFRLKHDVLPGDYSSLAFTATHPGEYEILCTEYCGTGHSAMRGRVVALPRDDYQKWLQATPASGQIATVRPPSQTRPNPADRPPRTAQQITPAASVPAPTMAKRGKRIAASHACFSCHTIDGRRHIGPTWRALYGAKRRLANGETVVATEDYLTDSIMDPRAQIVRGYDPVMPTYWGEMEPGEIAAVVEFIKTLKGERKDEQFPEVDPDDPESPAVRPRVGAQPARPTAAEQPPAAAQPTGGDAHAPGTLGVEPGLEVQQTPRRKERKRRKNAAEETQNPRAQPTRQPRPQRRKQPQGEP